jgi:uncharacterized protein (TIGR02001 family)
MKMKSLSLMVMLALGVPMMAHADSSLSGNVSLTSNYVFRGISQTGGHPAIQGGFDYSHSSGLYLGTWASNVNWLTDFQGYGSGSMELDLYGGYRNSAGPINYDVGYLAYVYPGKKYNAYADYQAYTADTQEIYGSLGWKWFTVKGSYYVSNGVFGFSNADGSYYLDLSGSLPLGDSGFTVGAHWGTFHFKNNGDANYDDWKISASYDMGKLAKLTNGMTVGVAYTDTNAKSYVWTDINNEDLSKGTAFVYISKSL